MIEQRAGSVTARPATRSGGALPRRRAVSAHGVRLIVALGLLALAGFVGWAASGMDAPDASAAPTLSTSFGAVLVLLMLLAGGVVGSVVRGRDRSPATLPEQQSMREEEAVPIGPAPTHAELVRARDVAEAANEAKTRHLVAISHEIRSPLNAIYGYAQLLERGDPVPGAEVGAVIRRSAEHLANLVDGLLEISRIESGVLKLRSDVIDIGGLLEQVVDMFRMQATAKGLSLALVIRDRLPDQVKTDEKRLRQILINLVSNAVKYTNEGGATITVGYRSQVIDVEVKDSGVGIPAEDIERIFEPFERGSAPDVQFQPGIGLGLAITRLLAHVLGGDIAVTSTPGVGSSFRLRVMLPVPARPVGRPERGRRITGYDGPRRTVIVIDDDPAQGIVLASFLRPLGFDVHNAANGAEGIALAARLAPDIVLVDIQMPGMSGWEAAAELRAAQGDALRIVMVSANAHEFRAGGDGRSNHDAFATKPVDLDSLLLLIGSQLGLRWIETAEEREAPAPAALPPEASPFLDRLRRLAKVGHVRGIEDALGDFEKSVPAAAWLATTLRRHLGDCDLRSFLKALDDAQT